MIFLLIGLAIFFGAHLYSALRSRDPENDIKARLGYGPYMGLYSLVSLIGLILIVYGYGEARPSSIIYTPPDWTRHVALALMLPALIALVASQVPAGYIKKMLKHPMLVSIKIWALAHLIANGELISLILFGSFLAYAVFDRIAVKRRGDNGPGPEVQLNAVWDMVSIIVGIGVYVAIAFWLHPILFGVQVVYG